MEEERARARRRWLIGIAALALAAGGFVAAGIAWLITGLSLCSGDGGSPYVAEDSVAGGFCDSGLTVPWGLLLVLGPPLAVSVGGYLAVRAVRWLPLLGGVGAALATVVVLAGGAFVLPSTCSDADQAAYDAWLTTDRSEPPPADCETY